MSTAKKEQASTASRILGLAKKGGASWLEQKGFDLIRPFVKSLVRAIPALVPDTPIEKVLMELYAMVPGFIEELFPENQKRNAFIADVLREVLNELKASAEGGGAGGQSKDGGKTMIVIRDLWVHKDDKTTVHHPDCVERHHLDEFSSGKKRKKQGAPDEEETKWLAKSGWFTVPFRVFVQSPALHPPVAPEPTCNCSVLIEGDRHEFEMQQAAKAEADKPKKDKGHAFRPEDVRAAAKWVGQGVGQLFTGLGGAARVVASKGGELAAKGAEVAGKVPVQAKVLDKRMSTHADQLATKLELEEKLDDLVEQFQPRKEKVKAFRAWLAGAYANDPTSLDRINPKYVAENFC